MSFCPAVLQCGGAAAGSLVLQEVEGLPEQTTCSVTLASRVGSSKRVGCDQFQRADSGFTGI